MYILSKRTRTAVTDLSSRRRGRPATSKTATVLTTCILYCTMQWGSETGSGTCTLCSEVLRQALVYVYSALCSEVVRQDLVHVHCALCSEVVRQDLVLCTVQKMQHCRKDLPQHLQEMEYYCGIQNRIVCLNLREWSIRLIGIPRPWWEARTLVNLVYKV
jgi:hypothetical protein